MSGDPQPCRFQFSIRNALIATAYLAIWCANWTYYKHHAYAKVHNAALDWLFVFLLAALPAAFVGALAGRHWFGLACAAASGFGVLLWIIVE